MNWIRIGAISGALFVAAGAFGAHALKTRLHAADLELWHTGVLYHALHAVALVVYGVFARERSGRAAGWSFLLGTLVFSGTLYAMALGGPRWLGAVTPLGGALLIVGWLAFALESKQRAR
jgi:uncharacterized membrane protein YgdD (TMEM256/DUF423 family)